MENGTLTFDHPVTLVGAGALDEAMLAEAMHHAPCLIAADGAADRLTAMGHVPNAVIGDMDSIADRLALERVTRVLSLPEQETTDFEKCLYMVEAPFYLAVGFTGRRLDHTFAVFDAMMRRPDRPVLLIGEEEVLALVPPVRRIEVLLGRGARVSFVGLNEATGTSSEGLAWSIAGLTMSMGRQVGTSNYATEDMVGFSFDRAGVLLMLERRQLRPLIDALISSDE
ncbi:MAG: thiamine diphosphokinase [Pseudomonadota bacterium]